MKYILDASVAVCWVIPRPLTPIAIQLRDEYLQQIHELLAPAGFIDEVAGALTKAVRQKDIAVGQLGEANQPIARKACHGRLIPVWKSLLFHREIADSTI